MLMCTCGHVLFMPLCMLMREGRVGSGGSKPAAELCAQQRRMCNPSRMRCVNHHCCCCGSCVAGAPYIGFTVVLQWGLQVACVIRWLSVYTTWCMGASCSQHAAGCDSASKQLTGVLSMFIVLVVSCQMPEHSHLGGHLLQDLILMS